VYKPHMRTLVDLTKIEIEAVHNLEKYEELLEKKRVFRKVINLVH
jgi:hypothetical protein